MTAARTCPVRVEGRLDEPLSRWLWLVKWLLAVPHYLVLAVLWAAYPFVGVVAFFAILVTGRYPRPLFGFTVGVLRWSWRVQFYATSALGTDRYPPFTLADVPDYPARLEVEYPQRLSRGLVLVKSWLLALPHLVLVGLFAGGGSWLTGRTGSDGFTWAAGGLVGVLVLVAGVVLLATGRYPRPLFDFVLGLDRWVLRVAAYVSLLTDAYPPFRLDQGGSEPGDTSPVPAPDTPAPARAAWTGGRTAAAIAGAALVLVSAGLLTGGAAVLWADRTQRDADGYFTASNTFSAGGYALTSDPIQLDGVEAGAAGWAATVGEARIRATGTEKPVFVGIARTADVARYLAAAEYTTVTDLTETGAVTTIHPGGALGGRPGDAGIWAAGATGVGTRTLVWPVRDGDWTLVVLNADGSRGVVAQVEAGATIPALGRVAAVVLGAGLLVLGGGVALIWLAARGAARGPGTPTVPAPEPERTTTV
ncbi:hypothetical protein Amsp01_058310 [Amycolatopsis sp. NBRC 101858]|uniref:DUF4389 domain-containing protein n=1 Tax=Amycolatopsis sp. NBRC 101858 TaxID=3032200 RepID=UPI0024A5AFD7|nr:DUF4389 domain-containing protein [Amycolatopsis sp. NBRC 101858]GLY39808.1 hypothetical protein Amsp01_058310 [Amycolatopsis sp. NBRC 101858]